MRYEQTIRVITVFFSTLIGFGLKKLLDAGTGDLAGVNGWLCFILAVLLFLRFLLGSANHLTLEYTSQEHPGASAGPLIRDLLFLIAFGILALWICYSASIGEFLSRSISLPAGGFVWSVLDPFLRRRELRPTLGKLAAPWYAINAFQLIALIVALGFESTLTQAAGVTSCLVVLVLVFMGLLIWDISVQLKALEEARLPVGRTAAAADPKSGPRGPLPAGGR